jgi:hypothetical protein
MVVGEDGAVGADERQLLRVRMSPPDDFDRENGHP